MQIRNSHLTGILSNVTSLISLLILISFYNDVCGQIERPDLPRRPKSNPIETENKAEGSDKKKPHPSFIGRSKVATSKQKQQATSTPIAKSSLSPAPAIRKPENLADEATKCLDNEKYDCAIEKATANIKSKGETVEALLIRGSAFFYKNDYAKAIEDLRKVIEKDSNDTDARFKLAYSYSQAGKNEAAIEHYLILNSKEPNNHVVLNNIGVAYEEMQEPEKAIENYRKAIEGAEAVSEPDPLYYSNMANLLHLKKSHEEEVIWLTKCESLDKEGEYESIKRLALAYEETHNYCEAVNYYGKSLGKSSGDLDSLTGFCLNAGRLGLEKIGSRSTSNMCDLAKRKDPGNPKINAVLWLLKANGSGFTVAMKTYAEADGFIGNDLDLRRRLPGLLWQGGSTTQALQQYKKIADLSGLPKDRFIEAIRLRQAGRLIEARNALDQVLAKEPDNYDATQEKKYIAIKLGELHSPPVELEVLVTDTEGKPILNLTKDRFTLMEGKVKQTIQSIYTDAPPLSLGIAIDTSGGMRPKLQLVSDAALNLVRRLNKEDEAFIAQFKAQAELLREFTNDKRELEDGLNELFTGGGTALFDAIIATADHAQVKARHRKKALVVITDGVELHSSHKKENVIKAIQEDDVQLYLVGIRGEYEDTGLYGKSTAKKAEDLLIGLAKDAGGRAFFLKDASAMPALMAQIISELRTHYVISYYPTESIKNSSYLNITVEVVPKDNRNLKARIFSPTDRLYNLILRHNDIIKDYEERVCDEKK